MKKRLKSNIKTSLIILLLFTSIISIGLLVNNFLNNTTYSLLNSIYVIQLNIESDNWDVSYNEIVKLKSEWQKNERVWSALIHHDEIDKISENMELLIEYIKAKDKTNSLSHIAVLRKYIEHIPELDKLNLQNIF
ncbi:MAG: hypothetical protein JG776_2030 [Caloramator sp.]|jgi:predicted PurR-regulated permease PerM|uniref:DUF4363 family protein n=1 Tax=Caloramator sp. TaxID=1871330 RepID=UPI001DBE1263|nr:DUF4363 family protein [Caloramator sp.]MBZ4664312.1 hypothetical protein [Caloramator sp.]